MTKLNPCRHCKKAPTTGFYPGDFAVECEDCRTFVSRHMVDFKGTFKRRAELAKENTIAAWNQIN